VIKIAPSILAANFANLESEVKNCEGADFIHIDIMDGHFVPNLTIGPLVVEAIRHHTKLPLDIHLMVNNPDNHLYDFAKTGADYLGVHVETCPNLHRTLSHIAELNKKAVVVLNPHTPLNYIEYTLELTDMITLMSVNPGFGGQKFIPTTLQKITALHHLIHKRKLNTKIQIDGGINENTIRPCINAGAQVFVVGSAIFNYPKGIAKAIKTLHKIAKKTPPKLIINQPK